MNNTVYDELLAMEKRYKGVIKAANHFVRNSTQLQSMEGLWGLPYWDSAATQAMVLFLESLAELSNEIDTVLAVNAVHSEAAKQEE